MMFQQMKTKRYENLILIPFNILYFTLQCPFRFQQQFQSALELPRKNGFQFEKTSDNPQVHITLVKKIPHQIFCATFHLLGLFVYTNEVLQIHVARNSNNPVEYLRLFLRVCSFLHHVNYVHLLWTKGPQLARLAEYLATKFRDDYGPLPKYGCILLPLIYICGALTSLVLLHESPSREDSAFKVLMDLRSPFFNPTKCNVQNISNFDGMEAKYILNTGISCLILYARLMLSYCTDVIIFTTVLSIHRPISFFYRRLCESPILDLEHFSLVLKEYGDLCGLVNLLNVAFSRLMLTYVLEAFSFYSVYLKEITVFDGECVSMQCKMGFLFLTFCTVFYLTADVSSLMDKSKFILINTNFTKSNGKELNLYLIDVRVQLHSHNYGVSGNGFFLINYSFVTTICSTLLTYFIISVQFQSRPS